jgi:hypothetical protein
MAGKLARLQIDRKLAELQAHATDHNCSVFVPDRSETEARACCHRSLSAELLARPAIAQYSHVARACRPRAHAAPSDVSSATQWDTEAARAKLEADATARLLAKVRHSKYMEQKVLKQRAKDDAKVALGGLAIGAAGATTAIVAREATIAGLTSVGEGLEVLGATTVEIGGIGAVIGVIGMGINAVGVYAATH